MTNDNKWIGGAAMIRLRGLVARLKYALSGEFPVEAQTQQEVCLSFMRKIGPMPNEIDTPEYDLYIKNYVARWLEYLYLYDYEEYVKTTTRMQNASQE